MKRLTSLLAAIALLGLAGLCASPASAQTLIHSTDWSSGAFGSTSTGAAGSTTGAGDGWIDVAGGVAHSGTTSLTLSLNGSPYTTGEQLLRPASENVRDERVTAYFAAPDGNANGPGIVLRYQGSDTMYFLLDYVAGGTLHNINLFADVAGSITRIDNGGQTFNSPTAGDIIALSFSASGVSPTTLSVTATDVTTGATLLGSDTYTDGTAQLQAAGQVGLQGLQGVSYTKAATYNLSAPAAAAAYTTALSATSGNVGTPVTLTFTPDGTTTATLTPTASGVSGTFSPTSVTLNGTTPVTVTFTPGAAGTATLTSSAPGLTSATGALTYTAASAALTVGPLTATAGASSVALSLSATVSGGTGSGYGYHVYRDTQPAVATTTPYATVSGATFAYTDSAVTAGTIYYYKVVAYDGGGDTAPAIPSGLGGATGSLAVAGAVLSGGLCVVYAGDSITAGNQLSVENSVTQTDAPYWADLYLSSQAKLLTVVGSNNGHDGDCWSDFQPGAGTDAFAGVQAFNNAESAMTTLLAANPTFTPVFSLMYGTNDSAAAGGHDPNASAASVQALAQSAISRLCTDFPGCKVVVNDPPLYTPNIAAAYSYNQASLALLVSYYPALASAVSAENGLYPGRVFVGDTSAPGYFAQTYLGEMTPQGGGANGTYYLHPNAQGANDLGRLWAQGIYRALYGTGTTTTTTTVTGTKRRLQ